MLNIIIHNMINKLQHFILVLHKVPSLASEYQEGPQLKLPQAYDPQPVQNSPVLQK